jgi:hypothetical protein
MPGERTPKDDEVKSDLTKETANKKTDSNINQAKKILEEIKLNENNEDIQFLNEKHQQLVDLYHKNITSNEIFYLMIEGLIEIAKNFSENWEGEFLTNLMEKLINFLERYLDNLNYLTAISDAIIQILEIITHFEFYDELEEYAIYIVNKSIDNEENLVLRTLAAEVTITAIKGFGEDWNYEKTKEFDIILKGLLPPNEIDGFLAGILIKGLAVEVDSYGDMHEFSSMKRTISLMNELFSKFDDIDNEFLIHYSTGLTNAITWFGEAEDYEEMMVALVKLATLSNKYPELIELKITYANTLRIALDYCGIMEFLEGATHLAKQLLIISDEFPENIEIQTLAIRGVFKAAIWAGAFWETGIITSLLTKTNRILKRFPEDNQLKILFARGLFNLTKELSQINKEKLMRKITGELASLTQKYPTIIDIPQFYSKTIVNMIYMLGEFTENFDDLYYYLGEVEKLANEYEDESIYISYSRSLVNSVRALGLHGKIEEMEKLLDVLTDLETTSDNFEITIRLGKAYIDAIKVYGDINEIEKVLQLYVIIKEWVTNDPHNIDLETIFAKALVNIISCFGKNSRISEMILYLDELRDLSILYPSFDVIQIQLAKGFTHSIRWYVNIGDLTRSISLFNELKTIRSNFSEYIELHEMVARSTRRIIILAYQQMKFELVEDMLENIRLQLGQYPDNENIQIELARALTNIILEESSKEKSSYWQSLVMELKGLTIQYPNNSKLAAIHQTVAPLLKE